MAEAWMLVGVGSTLMLFGFLASLVFERWHVPDFLLLLALGVVVGPGGLGLVPPEYGGAIDAVAPVFMAVAVAFILFEGGVGLDLRALGGQFPAVVAHALGVMAVTGVAMYAIGTVAFGLSKTGAVLFAAATIGPSASIVVSVAPRLRLDPRVQAAVVFESVLANVVSALVVVVLVQAHVAGTDVPGSASTLWNVGATVGVSLASGAVWLEIVRRIHHKRFLYMATLGLVLALYAFATGFLGGSGTLAAFVFGLVLGNRLLFARRASNPAALAWDADLARFHGEITFLIRTFFFLYLGYLFVLKGGIAKPLLFAAAVTLVYLAVRWPATRLLARKWALPDRDASIMTATLARGLTDAVLILYGVEIGLVGAAEGAFLTDAILLLVVLTAVATGGLIIGAERRAARRGEPAGERVLLTPRSIDLDVAPPLDEPLGRVR